MEISRRQFVKLSLVSGGGLLFAVTLPTCSQETGTDHQFDVYFRLNMDGSITYRDTKPEMGQGISTGLAMVACDELGADWQRLVIERPPLNTEMPIEHSLESSAGSNGMLAAYLPLRQAAANVRHVFIECACDIWRCSPEDCFVSQGKVHRLATSQAIAFSALFRGVIGRPLPTNAALKSDKDLTLIGAPVSILENQDIVTGQQEYAIDVALEGMVHASIERSPTTDARLVSVDDQLCRELNGVLETIVLPAFPYKTDESNQWQEKYRGTKSGVAVIAVSTWHALQGLRLLKTVWGESRYTGQDDQSIKDALLSIPQERIRDVVSSGDVDKEIAKATPTSLFESQYFNPYQENAHIEPLSAVAKYDGKTLSLWAGSQSPTLALYYVAEVTGVAVSNIKIHSMRSGGGFGRRYFFDFIAEAAYLAIQIRKPVKVTWRREDCMRHGRYHLARFDQHRLVLDAKNNPVAWDCLTRSGNNYGWLARNNMLDYYAGATIHRRCRHAESDSLVLLPGSWRSVDAHPQGLARECFIDEVADKLGVDPIAIRRQWLSQQAAHFQGEKLKPEMVKQRNEVQAGLLAMLNLASDNQEWNRTMQPNQGKGLSLSYFYGTYVCQMAFVSQSNKGIKVDKVVCLFDCGKVVNPQLVHGQIEGSIIWALSAVLNPAISVQNGAVVQSNFHDYPVLRLAETPVIDIQLVNSHRPPNRVGEAAVPDTAPAVLNAVFNLTGIRVRQLPLSATVFN
ncbi:molybdopterin-dependent oxidoreductase [Bowmanella denitrificans]|uniref:Molybdopterin-dependent oxidoreductase n=1 Tax=Bowmanella denitrificans TaxID=366582 RepID=A0ABP3GJ65_9ALTE